MTRPPYGLNDAGSAPQGVQEVTLPWEGGSALLRTVSSSDWHHRFVANDLAIVVITSACSGTEVAWRVDGNLALHKIWSRGAGSHDLIVLPPRSVLQVHGSGCGQALWLLFDPEAQALQGRVSDFCHRITVDCSWPKDRLLWAMIAEIRKECSNGSPRGREFLERAASMFGTQLTYVLEDPCHLKPARALSGGKLQTAIEYMEAHISRNVALSEVSDLVGLTPKYFCAAFKRSVGRPPHQYQLELRVERARTLLQTPNLSLVDVALCMGFSSQSHMTDCFRRVLGTTPARLKSATLNS